LLFVVLIKTKGLILKTQALWNRAPMEICQL